MGEICFIYGGVGGRVEKLYTTFIYCNIYNKSRELFLFCDIILTVYFRKQNYHIISNDVTTKLVKLIEGKLEVINKHRIYRINKLM